MPGVPGLGGPGVPGLGWPGCSWIDLVLVLPDSVPGLDYFVFSGRRSQPVNNHLHCVSCAVLPCTVLCSALVCCISCAAVLCRVLPRSVVQCWGLIVFFFARGVVTVSQLTISCVVLAVVS